MQHGITVTKDKVSGNIHATCKCGWHGQLPSNNEQAVRSLGQSHVDKHKNDVDNHRVPRTTPSAGMGKVHSVVPKQAALTGKKEVLHASEANVVRQVGQGQQQKEGPKESQPVGSVRGVDGPKAGTPEKAVDNPKVIDVKPVVPLAPKK